jgi:hypothetical protein
LSLLTPPPVSEQKRQRNDQNNGFIDIGGHECSYILQSNEGKSYVLTYFGNRFGQEDPRRAQEVFEGEENAADASETLLAQGR